MADDNWSQIDKFMSEETIDHIARSLELLAAEQHRRFCIVLHGGEPLLIGFSRLQYMLNKLRSVLPSEYPISLQTNGILITESILDLCSYFRASVAVSIDGPQEIHDRHRPDHRGRATFDRVIAGIERLQLHTDAEFLFAGVLAVVDPESDPTEIYQFFKELNPPSVDFLYRDGNHSCLPPGKSSARSTEYGKWMTGLLNAYVNDDQPLPIRVLDDMLKILLGGTSSKEGTGVSNYGIAVIDTDGSITKNDTLKSATNRGDRFNEDWRIHEDSFLQILGSTEFREYHAMQQPHATVCTACPELKVCGGGMTAHRWKSGTDYDNPTVYCADQLHLIRNMRALMANHGVRR